MLRKLGTITTTLARAFSNNLSTTARGNAAEDAALHFLRTQGLRLEARNFKAPGGEIDLIMQHAGTLVFVEVRARNRSDYGSAAASVTPAKQQRIAKAAARYLQQRAGDVPPCRFDVVAIAPDATPQWIAGAFEIH
jgi:putative endonuclease